MAEQSAANELQYIVCRVCGYIESASKRDKPCAACGFPPTVWVDYKPPRPINELRRQILDLHIHPVAVHFPVVMTVLVFAFTLTALGMPLFGFDHWVDDCFKVATIIAIFSPIPILVGFGTGMFAGWLRYKTLTAPAMKKKISLSIVYTILTFINCYMAAFDGIRFENSFETLAITGVAIVISGLLGIEGAKLFAGPFGLYKGGK